MRIERVEMSIERALIGFLGAVAAAVAASRAGSAVPEFVAAKPDAFFAHLVELRGATEMRRHADGLAAHVQGDLKAGRMTSGEIASQLAILTSIVTAFPPKVTSLAEALVRPAGRSAAAAGLMLASAVVSRAQARGRPEQARIDASWATDMIAEALAGVLSEPDFLAGVERAFASAARTEAINTPRQTGSFNDFQLREAHVRHGVGPDQIEGAIAEKVAKLRDLAKSLVAMAPDFGDDPVLLEAHGQTQPALLAGDLLLAAERIAVLGQRLKDLGKASVGASVFAALGHLEDIRLQPAVAALYFGQAFELAPQIEASRRWSYALRQAASLGAEADELLASGQASNRPLADAVRIYASVLGLLPSNEAPDLRSVTHNNLGNTLLRLGEIEGRADLFAHAAKSYRAAAGLMDRQRTGREWGLVQSNLGTALLKGGELAHAERSYEEAVTAYDKALTVLRAEVDGADWAAAEAGRGMAAGRLGAIRNDLGLLERTARSVDSALAQLDVKQAPAQWARLQSCLGNICADLGERIGGRHWLERAVAAYESAQEEWTVERAPLQWALSEANRGGAHLGLGTLTASRRHLHLAEDCLAHAAEVFARLGQTAYAASAEQSLKSVRTELGNGIASTSAPLASQMPDRLRV